MIGQQSHVPYVNTSPAELEPAICFIKPVSFLCVDWSCTHSLRTIKQVWVGFHIFVECSTPNVVITPNIVLIASHKNCPVLQACALTSSLADFNNLRWLRTAFFYSLQGHDPSNQSSLQPRKSSASLGLPSQWGCHIFSGTMRTMSKSEFLGSKKISTLGLWIWNSPFRKPGFQWESASCQNLVKTLVKKLLMILWKNHLLILLSSIPIQKSQPQSTWKSQPAKTIEKSSELPRIRVRGLSARTDCPPAAKAQRSMAGVDGEEFIVWTNSHLLIHG